jgi:hypothetical protein
MDTALTTPRPLQQPLGDALRPNDWEPILNAWWTHFGDEPVTVNDLYVALALDAGSDGVAIPTSLLRSRRNGPGSLKRSLGRRLAQRVGRAIAQFTVLDAGVDSHAHVRMWCLRRAQVESKQQAHQ